MVLTSAKLNTGFAAKGPHLGIPRKLAEALGLWPELPEDAYSLVASTAGGAVSLDICPGAFEVEVVTEDRTVGPIQAHAVILHARREALISDVLGDSLWIVPVRAGPGIWRFRDEPDRERSSVRSQVW
ncbi:MAG: hypothetical protein HY720_03425 [Planctomycetes bacterium]|nr:hypothetical protein [Planctomycetota bacterium]